VHSKSAEDTPLSLFVKHLVLLLRRLPENNSIAARSLRKPLQLNGMNRDLLG